jgi:Xaa-Pro aminopeptidase
MSEIDPGVIDVFDEHQRRAIEALSRTLRGLTPGMSESEIEHAARGHAQDLGFDKWYHPPEVQVGRRAADDRIWHRASDSARVAEGDVVGVAIAPGTDQAFGDIAASVVVGGDAPRVVGIAQECTRGCVGFATHLKTVGEVFVFAKAWAVNHAMELGNDRSIGHAMLPPQSGLLATDYPRSAHMVTWLRRHQVHFLNPARVDGMWLFRPRIRFQGVGASFGEAVWVNGEERRILGRDSIDECGTFDV